MKVLVCVDEISLVYVGLEIGQENFPNVKYGGCTKVFGNEVQTKIRQFVG